MRGSGEEDKRWEVTKTRVAFWIKKYSFCKPQLSMVEAVVCASCPESYHDRVAELACSIKSRKPLERLAIW